MTLNQHLILFQAREFEMAILFEGPSLNTLQICMQFSATKCSGYCYLGVTAEYPNKHSSYSLTCKSVAGYSAVKPLFVPFPLQSLCTSASPSPQKQNNNNNNKTIKTKAIRYLYPDRHKDGQTLTAYSLFRSWRLQLALYDRSTRFLKCNLSTIISIFPSLLETAVTEHIFARKKRR